MRGAREALGRPSLSGAPIESCRIQHYLKTIQRNEESRGSGRDRIASQVFRCRSSRAGMSAMHTPDSPDPQPARRFASTRWSLVAAAGQGASPEAQEALAVLCRVYWYPLYAYARRRLANVEDAQDATQAFFAQLL